MALNVMGDFIRWIRWRGRQAPVAQGRVRRPRTQNQHRGRSQGQRQVEYTTEEDRLIIEMIIAERWAERVGGNVIWREIEGRGVVVNRTWQGMKERFNRRILPNIRNPKYQMGLREIRYLEYGGEY